MIKVDGSSQNTVNRTLGSEENLDSEDYRELNAAKIKSKFRPDLDDVAEEQSVTDTRTKDINSIKEAFSKPSLLNQESSSIPLAQDSSLLVQVKQSSPIVYTETAKLA